MDRAYCSPSKRKSAEVNPPIMPMNSPLTGGGSWRHPLSAAQNPFSPYLTNYWAESSRSHLTAPYSTELFGPLTSTSTGLDWSTISSSLNCIPSPNATKEPAGWGKQSHGGPKYDGRDQLSLGEGWSLIHGDDAYFLELNETGLDVPVENISRSGRLFI